VELHEFREKFFEIPVCVGEEEKNQIKRRDIDGG
jgi:hypothetical protein